MPIIFCPIVDAKRSLSDSCSGRQPASVVWFSRRDVVSRDVFLRPGSSCLPSIPQRRGRSEALWGSVDQQYHHGLLGLMVVQSPAPQSFEARSQRSTVYNCRTSRRAMNPKSNLLHVVCEDRSGLLHRLRFLDASVFL